MKKFIFCLSILLTLSQAATAEIVVVVNVNNAAAWSQENIRNEIRDIFLGKRQKFSDNTMAKPVDQSEGKTIRKTFYSKIAEKDETAMNIYWSNLIFTGNGRPPKVLGDDNTVKKYVSETPEGIGYIDSGAADKTVKVIYSF